MPRYRLGKHRPKIDSRTLQFGPYLTKALPAPPASVDYTKPVTNWPMMGNDQYGDCTCAAAGHMIEEWTANTSKELILPDAQILKAYDHFSHGNPDAGANMLDVLKYWRKTGIGGDKITAFAQLEPQNDIQLRDSVNLFGSCYIGLALPNFAVKPGTDFLQTPWVVPGTGPMGIIEKQRSRNADDIAGGKFLIQLRPSHRPEVRAHFRSDAGAFVLIASTGGGIQQNDVNVAVFGTTDLTIH